MQAGRLASVGLALSAVVASAVGCGGGGAGPRPNPNDGTITVDASFASYRSEQGLTLGASSAAPAVALVPAQYNLTSTPQPVTDGATVQKAASRLGWSGAVTPADLEGSNTANVPALRIFLPHPSRYSDLTSVTATVNVTCAGCSFPAQTIDLSTWASTVSYSDRLGYLVPLAANTVTALGSLPAGTTQVALQISAQADWKIGETDRGGPWTVALDVLGAPLVVSFDVGYATTSDAKTAYFYKLPSVTFPSSNYTSLFETGAFATDSAVRLYHYVVSNPEPFPVALQASLPGTWTITEHWIGVDGGPTGSTWTSSTCGGYALSPCSTSQTYYQPAGGAWACGDPAIHPAKSLPTSATTDLHASGAPLVKAYQTSGSAPALTSLGRWIVPAANGTTPGVLDVYVDRPIMTAEQRALSPLPSPLSLNSTASAYTRRYETALAYVSTGQGTQCGQSTYYETVTWSGHFWDRSLSTSAEVVNGTLTLSGTTADDVGQPTVSLSSDLSTQSVSH